MAHCACMAGLGKACSHVVGLLFTLEADARHPVPTLLHAQSWLHHLFKMCHMNPGADPGGGVQEVRTPPPPFLSNMFG